MLYNWSGYFLFSEYFFFSEYFWKELCILRLTLKLRSETVCHSLKKLVSSLCWQTFIVFPQCLFHNTKSRKINKNWVMHFLNSATCNSCCLTEISVVRTCVNVCKCKVLIFANSSEDKHLEKQYIYLKETHLANCAPHSSNRSLSREHPESR